MKIAHFDPGLANTTVLFRKRHTDFTIRFI